VLQHVTIASLSLGAGGAGAATLSNLPAEVLGEVADAVRDPALTVDEKVRLVRLLSADARSAARVLAADRVGELYRTAPDDTLELVAHLAGDAATEVRRAAALALGDVLRQATPSERVEIVCDWTVAEDVGRRAAIAQALSLPLPLFVTDLAIRQLAIDPAVEVRRAAALATQRRYGEDEGTYREVAAILAADADPAVRRAGRGLLDG
jgi:hypothetical protein